MASEEVRSKYQLPSADASHYGFLKSKSNTYTIEDVNDAEKYRETMECLRSIDFSEEEIEQIWQVVASVLLLGNVEYEVHASDDTAHIKDHCMETLEKVAHLLHLEDLETFKTTLEAKIVKFGREVVATPFSLSEAISARNSCAKTIYGKLFNWIVSKVNVNIQSKIGTDTMDAEDIH